MSEGKLVSEILKEVCEHDQPILDLLMVDRNEMTTIQLANHFKRARSDMKMTIDRLKTGGHIKQGKYNYGKWHAVNYDFSLEVAAKRPNELVDKLTNLETDRKNAISKMSKSWQHNADDNDDLLTRFVEMANRQFEERDRLRECLLNLVKSAEVNEQQLNEVLMCGDYGESEELCKARNLLNE